MSPTCQNCGETVSKRYARVFTPNGVDNPRVCPYCEDMIREKGQVRQARSPRYGRTSDEQTGGPA